MRLQFVTREIGIGLWRNLSMTVSVIIVTAVSLGFLGAGLLFQRQVDITKGYWFDRVQVSIFLCGADSVGASCAEGEVTAEQRSAIEAELASDELAPFVDEVFYESKDEAYERFVEQFEDSALVENVTVDQMPESFRVSLVDPEQSETVRSFFEGRAGVETVDDQRELLEGLFRVLNYASAFAWGVAGIMIVAAILLVGTTIRLSAFNRRRETGIMRLVGASKFFIQLPFMLEGIFAAAVGALLASLGLMIFVAGVIQGRVADAVVATQFIGVSDVLLLAPILFAVAIVLAGVSSLITLERYLKV